MDNYRDGESRLRCCATCRHSYERAWSRRLECRLIEYCGRYYAVGRKKVCDCFEGKSAMRLMREAKGDK